ncbi:MAG TPA: hypothetical protein VG935_04360, partial [Patescibacteria group bacterium]|nr:hypothetical protein [Patescibacteria group bacterium]
MAEPGGIELPKITRRRALGLAGAAAVAALGKKFLGSGPNMNIPSSPSPTEMSTSQPPSTADLGPQSTAAVPPTEMPTETATAEPTQTPDDNKIIPRATESSESPRIQPRQTLDLTQVPTIMPSSPIETATTEPTKTPPAIPTHKPTKTPTPEPTATATHEAKHKRSYEEQLKDANPDYERMQQFVDSNTRIITQPYEAIQDPKLQGEWLPDGFGNGWCLYGMELTFKLAGFDLKDLQGIGSAYKAADIFRKHPKYFSEMNISRESLHKLPPGAILVYDHNEDTDPNGGIYDEVDGVHHGHICIVRGVDGQGRVKVGSDHEGDEAVDLSLLYHKVSVFIPTQQ